MHDVESFLRKLTHHVQISIGVTSNAVLTVSRLLEPGPGPNWMNKDFSPPAWKDCGKSIKALQLGTVNLEVVDVESIVPLFICIGDPEIRTRLGIF